MILFGGHTNTIDWGWTNKIRKYNIDTNTWETLTTKFDTGSRLAVAYGKGLVKSTLVEHNEYIYRFGGIQGFSYHYRPWLYTSPIYLHLIFDIFYFEISCLRNWIFFLVWTGFLQATQAVKIQFKLQSCA